MVRGQPPGKVLYHALRAEWGWALGEGVEHDPLTVAVGDREGHGVGAAARGIDKGLVLHVRQRGPLAAADIDAGVDRLARQEGFDVAAELGSVLGGRRALVVGIGGAYHGVVQLRVHDTGGGACHTSTGSCSWARGANAGLAPEVIQQLAAPIK